jgi:hypothetical protein
MDWIPEPWQIVPPRPREGDSGSPDYKRLYAHVHSGDDPEQLSRDLRADGRALGLSEQELKSLNELCAQHAFDAEALVDFAGRLTAMQVLLRTSAFLAIATVLWAGVFQVFPLVIAPYLAIASVLIAWKCTAGTWEWSGAFLKVVFLERKHPQFYSRARGKAVALAWGEVGYLLQRFRGMSARHEGEPGTPDIAEPEGQGRGRGALDAGSDASHTRQADNAVYHPEPDLGVTTEATTSLDPLEILRELIVDELLEDETWLPRFRSAQQAMVEGGVLIFSPGGSVQRRVTWFVYSLLIGNPDEIEVHPDCRARVLDALAPFVEESRRRLAARGITRISK